MLVAPSCVLLLIVATLVHYEALRVLGFTLPLLPMPSRAKVIVLIIGAFATHAIEIGLFAGAMQGLAHWTDPAAFGTAQPIDFRRVLYFSAETYTSLGYGDIVPHGPLRLLAGAEALTGLLMIGWSTSYVVLTMERVWDTPAPEVAKERVLAGGRGLRRGRAEMRPLRAQTVRPWRRRPRSPGRGRGAPTSLR
jgi:hypothetical protein